MSYSLNYAIRQTDGQLSGNLGWLFVMYWSHCDSLLRCFPSNDLLKVETDLSNAPLAKHRQKLIDMKSLVLVPHDKRLTKREKELHQRKYVYQITGVMLLDSGDLIPTININNPESFLTLASILEDLDFDISLLATAYKDRIVQWADDSKVSETERLKFQKLKLSDFSIRSSTLKDISTPLKNILALPDDDNSKNGSKPIKESKPSSKDDNRDVLFELILFIGWNINYSKLSKAERESSKEMGRVGKIKKRLLKLDPVPTETELRGFYKWYRIQYPNISAPKSDDKFLDNFMEFRLGNVTPEKNNSGAVDSYNAMLAEQKRLAELQKQGENQNDQ